MALNIFRQPTKRRGERGSMTHAYLAHDKGAACLYVSQKQQDAWNVLHSGHDGFYDRGSTFWLFFCF